MFILDERLNLDHGCLGDPVNFVDGQFGLSQDSCGLNQRAEVSCVFIFLLLRTVSVHVHLYKR